MNNQIRRLGIVLLALFVAVFVKLNELQVLKADELANHPGNNRKIVRDFGAPRGDIVTADGVVLARSVPTEERFGVQREYPEGALFGHLTGFFSFTYGTSGVERIYNDDLSGQRSDIRLRRPQDVLVDRDNTGDVVLTVSKALQTRAKEALGDRKGAIVALDPRTGAVLAMVDHPGFDPAPLAAHDQKQVQAAYQSLVSNPDKPLRSRAYQEIVAPGSTFKVVTSAAAIERAPELASKSYESVRQIVPPQTSRPLRNFGGSTCGGALPDLLKRSCNTGYAQLGLDMGAGTLVAEAEDFGFNSRPPLDLTGVATSRIPDADALDGDKPALAKSAIGQQDVRASPLLMAMMAGAVGNGGVMMTPHVMASVQDAEGSTVRTFEAEPWRTAMSPGDAAALRDMMVGVVNGGTATRAAVPGVQVAAKTGTAQVGDNTAHAWIVAFAPAEAPTVAVAVLIENQPEVNETTGGRLAAPIAATIITAALGG